MFKRLNCLLLLLLILALPACKPAVKEPAALPVGNLWVAPDGMAAVDWSAAGLAVIQQPGMEGYVLSITEEKTVDLQQTIREMAVTDGVLALMGPANNVDTMQAASLVNFFNIPMVVASAEGSSLFPSGNLWAFRLSPSAEEYARYLFGDVLNKAKMAEDVATQLEANNLRLAILYEDNTFGESAAVANAEAAMLQPMSIEKYANFPVVSPDRDRMRNLANDTIMGRAQLVVLVSSDPEVALMMVDLVRQTYLSMNFPQPMIIGQAGGFANPVFYTDVRAEGVYVMRQALIAEGCPASVQSSYDAQTYAAAYLLNEAVREARLNTPAVRTIPIIGKEDNTELVTLRGNVRAYISSYNQDVPCIGRVSFDNANQNTGAKIEITRVENNSLTLVLPDDFRLAVRQQIESYFSPQASGNGN